MEFLLNCDAVGLLANHGYVLEFDNMEDDVQERIGLLWKFSMCLYSNGIYNEAERLFSQVREMRERVLGSGHPSALTSMANLASMYRNQERWKDAEELEV